MATVRYFIRKFWKLLLVIIGFVILLIWGIASCGSDTRVVERTVTVPGPATTVTVEVPTPPPPPPPPPDFWPTVNGQRLPVMGMLEGEYGQVRNLGRELQSHSSWTDNPHRQVVRRVSVGAQESVFAVALADALGVPAVRLAARRGGATGLTDEHGRYTDVGENFSRRLRSDMRHRQGGSVTQLPDGRYKVWMANSDHTYYSESRHADSLRVDGPLAAFRGPCNGFVYVDRRGNLYTRCQTVVRVERQPPVVTEPEPPAPVPPPQPSPPVTQPAPRPNQPPTVRFTNRHQIIVGRTQRICVAVSDPEGQQVTVQFRAGAGSITQVDDLCADFTAPGSVGTAGVTVTARDSKGIVNEETLTVPVVADDGWNP